VQEFNKNRLCSGACLRWQSQKRDPPMVLLQAPAPARSSRQEVQYDMQMHYDSSMQLK
jgi:hypothetical protein